MFDAKGVYFCLASIGKILFKVKGLIANVVSQTMSH